MFALAALGGFFFVIFGGIVIFIGIIWLIAHLIADNVRINRSEEESRRAKIEMERKNNEKAKEFERQRKERERELKKQIRKENREMDKKGDSGRRQLGKKWK